MEKKLPSAYRRFASDHPRIAEAYERLSDASLTEGPLDRKQAELVKIGIALGEGEPRRTEEVLKDAELAMYHAKRIGGDRIEVFKPSMRARQSDRVTLESELRRALEREEITILYQPIVRLEDRSVAGFEVMPRWRHPKVARASPAEFIAMAEEVGLIVDLAMFVVERAARQLSGWQRAVRELKDAGLVRAFGISVNRWEPANVLRALDTGLVDSVQVVYNIFDQAPEDALFPYCQAHDIAVIARVPFDEGSLTGSVTAQSRWPDGDFRNIYFNLENLANTVEHVARLKPLVPAGMDLPELALRFILEHPAVSTTIPGMRKPRHVERNIAVSDGERLPSRLRDALRAHRWDRMLDIP